MIGHYRDPIHPFSDSDMLVRELPNARLVQASSVLELRLTPERLTGEIVQFVERCFKPKSRGGRRAAGRRVRPGAGRTRPASLPPRCPVAESRRRRCAASASGARPRRGPPQQRKRLVGIGGRGGDRGRGGRDPRGRRGRRRWRATPRPRATPSRAAARCPSRRCSTSTKAAAAAGCELKSNKATSREHLQDPNQKVNYPQNPPTSGKHYAVPAEDGLYNGTPPHDTALVHALEHGRVIIWAKPSLPVEARKQIRALFDEDSYQMIVVRRPNMPYAVAATAWSRDPTPNGTGRLMGCPKWNENVIDALRTFRDEHRSNGPEDIP